MQSCESQCSSKLQLFTWLAVVIVGGIALPIIDMLRESIPAIGIAAQMGLIIGSGLLGFAALPFLSRYEKKLPDVVQVFLWLLPLFAMAGATLYFQLQHGGEAILLYIVAPILASTYQNTQKKLPTTRAEWAFIILIVLVSVLLMLVYIFSDQITETILRQVFSIS